MENNVSIEKVDSTNTIRKDNKSPSKIGMKRPLENKMSMIPPNYQGFSLLKMGSEQPTAVVATKTPVVATKTPVVTAKPKIN